ncbi:MAG: hypothetical protein ACRCTZ_11390 [Sarcina sp.]
MNNRQKYLINKQPHMNIYYKRKTWDSFNKDKKEDFKNNNKLIRWLLHIKGIYFLYVTIKNYPFVYICIFFECIFILNVIHNLIILKSSGFALKDLYIIKQIYVKRFDNTLWASFYLFIFSILLAMIYNQANYEIWFEFKCCGRYIRYKKDTNYELLNQKFSKLTDEDLYYLNYELQQRDTDISLMKFLENSKLNASIAIATIIIAFAKLGGNVNKSFLDKVFHSIMVGVVVIGIELAILNIKYFVEIQKKCFTKEIKDKISFIINNKSDTL